MNLPEILAQTMWEREYIYYKPVDAIVWEQVKDMYIRRAEDIIESLNKKGIEIRRKK